VVRTSEDTTCPTSLSGAQDSTSRRDPQKSGLYEPGILGRTPCVNAAACACPSAPARNQCSGSLGEMEIVVHQL